MEQNNTLLKVVVGTTIVQTIILVVMGVSFLSQVDTLIAKIGESEQKAKRLWGQVENHLNRMHTDGSNTVWTNP